MLQIILSEKENNFCAKCCKTKQVIERMLENFPEFREKLDIQYKNIDKDKSIKKYGELSAPVVILNDSIFSEGHVPIIKRLCRKIIETIEIS